MLTKINADKYESEHFEVILQVYSNPGVCKTREEWVIYRKNKCTPLGSSKRLYRVRQMIEKLEERLAEKGY